MKRLRVCLGMAIGIMCNMNSFASDSTNTQDYLQGASKPQIQNPDMDSEGIKVNITEYTSGIGFTGLLINSLKLKGRKLSYWKECGLLSRRETDLFEPGYMELFVNTFTENLVDKDFHNLIPVMNATRQQYINDVLKDYFDKYNIRQIIILGTGFDVRAATYTFSNLKYFEIDAKHVLDIKKQIYKENNINPNATYISIDYIKENIIQSLKEAKVNFKETTLFIYEGNSMYIKEELLNDLFNKIKNNFSSYYLVIDYFSNRFITKTTGIKENDSLLDYFANMKLQFVTGFDNIAEFCEKNSLKILENHSIGKLVDFYNIHDKNIPEMQDYFMACMQNTN